MLHVFLFFICAKIRRGDEIISEQTDILNHEATFAAEVINRVINKSHISPGNNNARKTLKMVDMYHNNSKEWYLVWYKVTEDQAHYSKISHSVATDS